MFQAAEELRFEYAAKLRDELKELRREPERARGDAGLNRPHRAAAAANRRPARVWGLREVDAGSGAAARAKSREAVCSKSGCCQTYVSTLSVRSSMP